MVGRRLKDSFRNSSIGVQMVKHVTIDRGRRALLGATGALALQGIFRSTAAVGQAAGQTASVKMKLGIIGAGRIGGLIGQLGMARSPTRSSATASVSRRKNICRAHGWCAPSTRSTIRSLRAKRTALLPD